MHIQRIGFISFTSISSTGQSCRERERERENERNQRGREHDRVGCHSVTSTSKHGVYQAPLPHFHTYTHTNTLTDSDYCIYITAEAFHILNFSFTFKSIPIQSLVYCHICAILKLTGCIPHKGKSDMNLFDTYGDDEMRNVFKHTHARTHARTHTHTKSSVLLQLCAEMNSLSL